MPASEDTPDQRTADALATLFEARELLNNLDSNALTDSAQSRLWNARDQLDEIVINLSPEDLQAGLDGVQTLPVTEEPECTSAAPDGLPSETPDDVVKQRHAAATPGDTVPITVELDPELVELIDIARADDKTFTEWLTKTAEAQLLYYEQQLRGSVTQSVEVPVPPEVQQWATAWTAYNAPGDPSEEKIEQLLLEFLDLDFEWSHDTDRSGGA